VSFGNPYNKAVSEFEIGKLILENLDFMIKLGANLKFKQKNFKIKIPEIQTKTFFVWIVDPKS
jgi:hypothetical protein